MDSYFERIILRVEGLLTETQKQKSKVDELMELSGEVMREADRMLRDIRELKRLVSFPTIPVPEVKVRDSKESARLIKERVTELGKRIEHITRLSALTASEVCTLDCKALELEERSYIHVKSELKSLFADEHFTIRNANYILPDFPMGIQEGEWLGSSERP